VRLLHQIRFKDEFLSHVSHELRSPLTAIKQFTTILLGGLAGPLNDEQREFQEIVLKNVLQLQAMIDDLLEVTRLETGKLSVEPEKASIAEAVADALNTLQGLAVAKGVTLRSEVGSDVPAAYADRARLRQILIILLDNAIKFTAERGAVTVRALRRPQDPLFLHVEVSDTGCGISPEMIARIFERLYQVEGAAESSRKGLGLGLYICKELVSRQGGTIHIESTPGVGSIFSFTLPVFCLANAIAPLFKEGRWPGESVALVAVETRFPDGSPSPDLRHDSSVHVRSVLRQCLFSDVDVLLPRMGRSGDEDRAFVAAFADATGAAALAGRVRGQLERDRRPADPAMDVTVSYRMLHPSPVPSDASEEAVVASMAATFESSMNEHAAPRAAHHE
jgi:anti-sigma regulatory factor (Ser/Thr protein kinase)